jgi:hypothetical protein
MPFEFEKLDTIPLNITDIRNYSDNELYQLMEKLHAELHETQNSLEVVESRVRDYLNDKSTKLSDLSPLFAHKEDLKERWNVLKCNMDVVSRIMKERRNSKEEGFKVSDPIEVVTSIMGSGVGSIRASDSRSEKIDKAKKYEEIYKEMQAEKNKQKGQVEVLIGMLLEKLEEVNRKTETPAQTQAQSQSQTQTSI